MAAGSGWTLNEKAQLNNKLSRRGFGEQTFASLTAEKWPRNKKKLCAFRSVLAKKGLRSSQQATCRGPKEKLTELFAIEKKEGERSSSHGTKLVYES